ncbi:MAG: carboxypeptidase-like regulatory domain-containing protein [Flavobacteriales bacterium]
MNRPPLSSVLSLVVALAWSFSAQGQTNPRSANVVQVSGLVVTGDSLAPLPYCTVFRARDRRGTMTDVRGFFSLPALEGDTLEFSSVGYVTQQAVIPVGSELGRVNLVQPLGRDTVNMADAFVYPWPSKERFKQEFLALGLPNNGLNPAWESNLDPMDMYDRLIEVGRDGQSTSTDVLSAQAVQSGYAGQAPPVNLLNPVAWAKFLQALKAGELKRE